MLCIPKNITKYHFKKVHVNITGVVKGKPVGQFKSQDIKDIKGGEAVGIMCYGVKKD